MTRPSIALACILKNEVANLPQLLESVKGCFDEIHLTDTGSTDGSIELIQKYVEGPNPAETKVFLHHFEWVDDFAAARNASFVPCQTDYVMWMDLDDVLANPDAFIDWRDNVMKIAEYWLATYHYSSDTSGKPVCSFARERVLKRSCGFKWKYFVHEGINPNEAEKKNIVGQYASVWSVVHKRTEEDARKDKSRNLTIFTKNKARMDSRMQYYYGKELFEAQQPLEAFPQLIASVALPDLEPHDRIMGIQYAALSAMQLNQFERAIQLAHQGLQLAPTRAEFAIVIGDSYLKLGKFLEAIPFYKAASGCQFHSGPIQGALFSHEDSYKHYPLNQMARIYANIGDMNRAEKSVNEALEFGPHFESDGIRNNIADIKKSAGLTINLPKAKGEDIVISGWPQGFYEWDEEIYRTRGIGGSETAVVEMASHLGRLTGRKVLVFNNRSSAKHFGNVSYLPASDLPAYFSTHEPHRHIAWRHNIKFTDAPTYLWCHDLAVPGIEHTQQYEKVFALSNFHKNYLSGMYGVPKDKIWVTSNGIDPKRFLGTPKVKDPYKIVYSSSPDRGLDRAIAVMDMVVRDAPEAKLHVYYGFENLYKNGHGKEADRLKTLCLERPYVVLRGNLPQEELTKELASACVWLYPTNFLETYCITAIEMLCSQVWPVVRAWGALPDTLHNQKAFLLDTESAEPFACDVLQVLRGKQWETIEVNPEDYSWEKVAKSWIEYLGL